MKKNSIISILCIIGLISIFIVDYIKDSFYIKRIESGIISNYSKIINENLIEENNNLKEIYKIEKSNMNYYLCVGRYIDLYKEIYLNKGTKDGIQKDYMVINEDGLVGIVYKVYKNYSIVTPINNIKRSLSVKINNNYGILNIENGKAIVSGIMASNAKINDKVYTSGLTNIIGNIYIGSVEKINNMDSLFKTTLELKLSNEINKNKYLMVLGV